MDAVMTVPYGEALAATGGDSVYTWSVAVGSLPPGLSLAASTGVISGTPTGASATFTVQVASGDGQTDTQQLTIDVYDVLSVTTMSLPSGSTGVVYSDALVATGGDGSYAWSITVGSLPTGLSLNASTGLISGTPSAEASDTFTVQVVSGDGQTASQQLSISVALVLQPSERCSDYPDYAIASFEDANLESAIRETLSLGAQERPSCGQVSGLTDLDAGNHGIRSLAGIQNLTGLRSLSLHYNSISDIAALSGLATLTYLRLSGNSITDISAVSGLTSLTWLDLSRNSISDINALSGLTSLQSLDLSINSITDISALSEFTNLTWLNLDLNNSISDISALSGLTSLTVLYLNYNSISDISALTGLTSLWALYLGDNAISDISAVSALTSLTVLYLGTNAVSDISALSGLTSLTLLYLYSNSISDIRALSGLTSLSKLWLTNNPALTDIQPLLDNTGLGAGDTVWLASTNVSCTDLAALQAKGVTVYSDCP
jgi:Leucine-rich repeat (LRR) protein